MLYVHLLVLPPSKLVPAPAMRIVMGLLRMLLALVLLLLLLLLILELVGIVKFDFAPYNRQKVTEQI